MATVETATEIRPFQVEVPQEQLDDLRRRIQATRVPSKGLVEDRSQGVQLATIRELATYWATDYDWRKVEAKLNALPQFTTEIDGVDIHFIGRPICRLGRAGALLHRGASRLQVSAPMTPSSSALPRRTFNPDTDH